MSQLFARKSVAELTAGASGEAAGVVRGVHLATPEMATLPISTDPRARRARMSRSLPRRRFGFSFSGSSNTAMRAVRMPESQRRPE